VNAQPTRPVGRVLAIDYGTVRLGLAVSDPQQQFASPYANYNRVTPDRDLQYLRRVLQQEDIAQIVVGLPVHLDGRESEKSLEVRRFAAWLAAETAVPVTLYDERFTSVEAESHLRAAKLSRKRRKARRDMLAAQSLLAAYLESDRQRDHSAPGGLGDSPTGDA
jgi:putative holliday junction resolvase